jgi:hypothetical protein
VKQFALWLSATPPSVFIQVHNAWTIPALQAIHIVGITLVMGSALMIDLRILGWAGRDQTVRQTASRFGPWLVGALWLMLATGGLMVIGQPTRELMSFSFRLKMALVATGAIVGVIVVRTLRRREQEAGDRLVSQASVRALAIVTFLAWVCVIMLGRLIAYDHVWGAWSPSGQ